MSDMSYTGRDVVAIRRSLVDMIPKLTDKWKDFNESDLGMIILELIAGAQDMQNFYFDAQAFETYLDTAVQEKNIRSLLRAMNYRIPLIGPAKGSVRVKYKTDEPKKAIFPKYTQFECSSSKIKYVASDTVYANTVDGYIDIPVMEGEYKEKKITKREIASNVTSSGKVSRRIYLGYSTVADRSVEICQDGVIWEEVDDALLEYNGGYVFSVHKDSNNQVYLLMSVNFMDLLPVNEEEEIVIKFVISCGRSGVVKAGEIDSIIDGKISLTGITDCYNLVDTYGAWDEVDLQHAKVLARRQAQTMGRYITLDDYKNGVETEPYIMKCVVHDWRTDESIREPYLVNIWAVDWGGNSLGEQDKATLISKLISKGVSDVSVSVKDVEIVPYDIKIKLILKTASESDSQKVRALVEENLYEMYKVDNMGFGEEISISMLNSRVKVMSPYIKEVIIESPESDVETSYIQFPKLRDVSVEIIGRV